MKRELIELHVVCRGGLFVHHMPDGTFETGYWWISAEQAACLKTIALHETMKSDSYLQGEVLDHRFEEYENKLRAVFTVRPSASPLPWSGSGARGYGRVYA